MKITRANVEKYAKERGFEPIQIDGVPEGFSWKSPSVNIGGVEHKGKVVIFSPLKDWDDPKAITYE